jgi:hypothetical protein
MQMYVEQKLKPMTLDKTSIYKNAESIYHPGKNPDKMRAKGKEALSAL